MKEVFAVHDLKAAGMGELFTSINIQTAMREQEIALKADPKLRDYAADFCLMKVGTWDPQDGLTAQPAEVVITLDQLVAADAESPS